MSEKKRVCVLVGPTASGKTGASLSVAETLAMEIVSADSMQVYRGMDIGTAKAAADERARVRHHMIDVADPCEKYTAARYRDEAAAAVDDIHARGRIPLVVGGTGLYVSALLDGFNFAQTQGGDDERARWERYLLENGAVALHECLAERDSVAAAKLHPNDTRRVIRALEVFSLTGETMTERAAFAPSPYDVRIAGLMLDRAELYRRIDMRVLAMMREGLIEEARALYESDAPTAAQALGYKELFAVFRGEMPMDAAVEKIQRATRRYAKRQMTWFRRDTRICWFDASQSDLIGSLIDFFQS